MLYQIIQNIEEFDVRLFALVLTCISQRKIHEQSSCILNAVICQLISLVSQNCRNPLDEIKLDHDSLWLPTKGELLKRSKSILPQVSISLLFFEYFDQCFHQVSFLQQVRPSEALIS